MWYQDDVWRQCSEVIETQRCAGWGAVFGIDLTDPKNIKSREKLHCLWTPWGPETRFDIRSAVRKGLDQVWFVGPDSFAIVILVAVAPWRSKMLHVFFFLEYILFFPFSLLILASFIFLEVCK